MSKLSNFSFFLRSIYLFGGGGGDWSERETEKILVVVVADRTFLEDIPSFLGKLGGLLITSEHESFNLEQAEDLVVDSEYGKYHDADDIEADEDDENDRERGGIRRIGFSEICDRVSASHNHGKGTLIIVRDLHHANEVVADRSADTAQQKSEEENAVRGRMVRNELVEVEYANAEYCQVSAVGHVKDEYDADGLLQPSLGGQNVEQQRKRREVDAHVVHDQQNKLFIDDKDGA